MDINWIHISQNLFQLAIAFVLALPLAIDREYTAKGAGLRTFPLVSIAACAYMLVGIRVFPDAESQARVMYGIIGGMGFIGGGAILKGKDQVIGTATAAALWNTGAIGISVAFKLYEIAITLSVVSLAVFQLFRPLKKQNPSSDRTLD